MYNCMKLWLVEIGKDKYNFAIFPIVGGFCIIIFPFSMKGWITID